MKTVIAVFIIAVLLAVASGGAPPSRAAFPGANGKIVFASRRTGNGDIYAMNPDGTALTQLTTSNHFDGDPAWSADGSRIAFQSDRTGYDEIWVMNADGSGQTQLTFIEGLSTDPAWSPDGTKIALVSDSSGDDEIFVVNADGAGPVNLTDNPAHDTSPSWSPDGQHIVFSSHRDGDWEIYRMDAGGGNPVRLTTIAGFDGGPSWSPDGSRIAFVRELGNGVYTIQAMDPDGTDVAQLTYFASGWDEEPAWSPDGTKIVFERSSDAVKNDLYMINADGTGLIQLTDHAEDDWSADWQSAPGITGDVNCDGEVNAVDALIILRHVAGLPFSLPPGCPGVSWPTFHGPNPVVSSGTGSLGGTNLFDFDTGTQTLAGDVWWEMIEYGDHTVGNIVPMGDARAVNLGIVDFDSLSYPGLWYLPFSTTPIHGSDGADSELPPGDVFAVLTSDGNVAKVRVEAYAYTLQLRWVTYQGAPRGDLNCDGEVNAVDALLILRFVAGLPNNPIVGCPAIGA